MEVRKAYAFFLPWSIDIPGGVNHVVKNLIAEFRESGEYRPILIENHWPSLDPYVLESHPDFARIRIRMRPLDNTRLRVPLMYLLTLPRALWRLKRLLGAHKICVVNVHFPGLDALTWTLLRALRLGEFKVILSFHGSDIRAAYETRGWPRTVFRLLMRQADAVVSCSEGLQREVLAIEGRARGYVIRNGIDEVRFLGRAACSLEAMPFRMEEQIILNIGRYEFRKGHDLLLQAFRSVVERRRHVHLVIVGTKGPEFEKTRALVRRMDLSPYVTLHHDLPHAAIPDVLRSADLFVLSSRWIPGRIGEGFPVALLEAAAAERPVVTTSTCGAAEIVEDGVSGRVVPLENADALAAAIIDMLENPERARRMATNLKQRALRDFTWKRACNDYHSIVSA